MKATRRRAARILGVGLLAASGCATVQHGGGMQKVRIETRPPGATALILPDEILLETPAELRIARRQARTIRLELAGYCRETVYLDRIASWSTILNAVLGGLVGLWIDTSTGAAYTLRPDRVNVYLWPADSPDRECGPAGAILPREPRSLPEPL